MGRMGPHSSGRTRGGFAYLWSRQGRIGSKSACAQVAPGEESKGTLSRARRSGLGAVCNMRAGAAYGGRGGVAPHRAHRACFSHSM